MRSIQKNTLPLGKTPNQFLVFYIYVIFKQNQITKWSKKPKRSQKIVLLLTGIRHPQRKNHHFVETFSNNYFEMSEKQA